MANQYHLEHTYDPTHYQLKPLLSWTHLLAINPYAAGG